MRLGVKISKNLLDDPMNARLGRSAIERGSSLTCCQIVIVYGWKLSDVSLGACAYVLVTRLEIARK